ncbi:hypothetical protein ACQP1G_37805 [Nocardia sp. CA-107356]|uniref:hypothetical protein n=1 Tax=Nocardia sp. CA-107356 TaxID=3239972 RepID=UPI003D8D33AC
MVDLHEPEALATLSANVMNDRPADADQEPFFEVTRCRVWRGAGHHTLGSVTSSRSWSRSTAASPSEARLLPQTRHLQVGESHRAENLIFELWEITSDGSSSRSPPFNDG